MSVAIPDVLKEAMRLYRVADAPLPKQYVAFHAMLARTDLNFRLKSDDWVMLDDLGRDSARDVGGMPVYSAVVAVNEGFGPGGWSTHLIKWHESGAWFSGNVRFCSMLDHVYDRVRMTLPLSWTEEKILEDQLRAA